MQRHTSASSMDVLQYLGLGSSSAFGVAHPAGELQDMADMAHSDALHQQRIHSSQAHHHVSPDGMVHHNHYHSQAALLDMFQAGGTVESEIMQLDVLRLQRLAAAVPAVAVQLQLQHNVGGAAMVDIDTVMSMEDEHDYWASNNTDDGRYEDDNVVWARRHDHGNLPSFPSPAALAPPHFLPSSQSSPSDASQRVHPGGGGGVGGGFMSGGGGGGSDISSVGRRSSASELFFG